jgi:hypothetical protein
VAEARSRLVLIGASNASRALPGVLRALDARAGPHELLVAAGHGRSYGSPSRYFARELRPILECGLWPELARAGPPVRALVTDVGNDLAYGVNAARIAGWVDEVLARLAAANARITLTALPLANLEQLSPLFFHAVRILVFRGRPLEREHVLREARELDQRMAEIARARGALHVRIPPECIGWDGIHQRRALRSTLWDQWLRDLGLELDRAHGCRFRGTLRAQERRLFGREQRTAQPCARSAEGSTLSIF